MDASRFWHGELEAASPEQRIASQEERLRAHLPQALRSPFLRARWQAADVAAEDVRTLADLARLPHFDKPSIIEAQAAAPPYGSLLAVEPEELNRTYLSPGPEAVFFTAADLARLAEHTAWALHTTGVRPSDVVDVTPMYNWVLAGTMLDDGYRRIGCNVIPGGAGSSELHVEHMRWLGVTALFTFPTFLEQLARQVEDAGFDPHRDMRVRQVTIAGEMSSMESRKRMESFFGCQVREMYGGAEVPNVAAECEAGGGMHLNPHYIVEVVDAEDHTPVAPGDPGVIVLTDLERRAMPIIRYFTSDLTSGLDLTPCECGRTTPRLGRILGRTGEIPRVKGLFVVPRQVAAALEPFRVGRFQLVIDRPDHRDHLVVRVEAPEASPGLAEGLATALKHHIRLSAEVQLCALGTFGTDDPVVVDRRGA